MSTSFTRACASSLGIFLGCGNLSGSPRDWTAFKLPRTLLHYSWSDVDIDSGVSVTPVNGNPQWRARRVGDVSVVPCKVVTEDSGAYHVARDVGAWAYSRGCFRSRAPAMGDIDTCREKTDITPYPGGHRPQRRYAQGRTCARQDQAQAARRSRIRTAGGVTTDRRRTRQAGESAPT